MKLLRFWQLMAVCALISACSCNAKDVQRYQVDAKSDGDLSNICRDSSIIEVNEFEDMGDTLT